MKLKSSGLNFIFLLNLGAGGAGHLWGLQVVTKTLHLVLKLFLSEMLKSEVPQNFHRMTF